MKPILFLIFSFIYVANCHSQNVSNLQNPLPPKPGDKDPIYQHVDSILLINNNIRSSGLSLDSSIVFYINLQNQTLFPAEIYKYDYDFHGNRKSIISLTPGDTTYAYFNHYNQLDSSINIHRYGTVDSTIYVYSYDNYNNLKKIEERLTYEYRGVNGELNVYYFDSTGNLTSQEKFANYPDNLLLVELIAQTYDTSNNLLEMVRKRWNIQTQKMVNDVKTTYTYTSRNDIESYTREDWLFGKWSYYGSMHYVYNTLGLLVEYRKEGSFASSSAINFYEYDTFNNLKKVSGFNHQNRKYELLHINSLPNGSFLTSEYYRWKNNQWELKFAQSFQYNNHNDVIEKTSISSPYPNDTTGYKITTTYDSSGNWNEKHYFDYQNSTWLETEFENNVFDLSISTQQLILPQQSPYFNKIDTNNTYYKNYSNGQFYLSKFKAFYYSNFALSVANHKINLFKVYPNPALENIQIQVNERISFSIRVFDQTGKIVLQNQLIESNNKVNISHLTQGVYYILIESEKETQTHKIIKL